MPDIQQFSLSARTDANVNVARVTVAARVVADTGATLADFTGANAFDFALRVPGFTAAQHRELAEEVAHWLIRKKAGL